MDSEISEQAHAVGTIICTGDMILEVYDGNSVHEACEGSEPNDETVATEPGGTEACEFASNNDNQSNIIKGIVVNDINNVFGETFKEMVTAEDQNGETVLVYVNESSSAYGEITNLNSEEKNEVNVKNGDFLNDDLSKLNGTFNCDTCVKTFTRKHDLKRHQVRQGCSFKNMNGNSCPICESKFGDVLKKKRPFVCGICDKAFFLVRDLKKHFAVHVKTQRYICDLCNEAFDTSDALKRHSLTHGSEKHHSCPVCLKSFRFKCNLNSHMRVHSEDRPFGCDVCEKGFKSACELKSHKYIHTNEKPYGCPICGKHFRQNGNLNAHLRVHRQEKPFICVVCKKGFVESGKLKRHFRIHTLEKPYRCVTCGKSFCDSSNLKAHVKIHEKNDQNVMVLMYIEEDELAVDQ